MGCEWGGVASGFRKMGQSLLYAGNNSLYISQHSCIKSFQ